MRKIFPFDDVIMDTSVMTFVYQFTIETLSFRYGISISSISCFAKTKCVRYIYICIYIYVYIYSKLKMDEKCTWLGSQCSSVWCMPLHTFNKIYKKVPQLLPFIVIKGTLFIHKTTKALHISIYSQEIQERLSCINGMQFHIGIAGQHTNDKIRTSDR